MVARWGTVCRHAVAADHDQSCVTPSTSTMSGRNPTQVLEPKHRCESRRCRGQCFGASSPTRPGTPQSCRSPTAPNREQGFYRTTVCVYSNQIVAIVALCRCGRERRQAFLLGGQEVKRSANPVDAYFLVIAPATASPPA